MTTIVLRFEVPDDEHLALFTEGGEGRFPVGYLELNPDGAQVRFAAVFYGDAPIHLLAQFTNRVARLAQQVLAQDETLEFVSLPDGRVVVPVRFDGVAIPDHVPSEWSTP